MFRFGLWPAALELWRIAPTDPRARQWETARWKDGQLVMPGLAPLPLAGARGEGACAQLRDRRDDARLFPLGLVAGDASRSPDETWTADIDALAVRHGAGKFARLDRTSVKFPPTDFNRIGTAYTSLCGTLVRVEIERATGALRIAKAYSVLECGQALVPEVVLGQAQGGFAMGVGYALLESLPPYEGGPGNGQWNLGQYLIARGSDLPLRDLEIEVLPPLTPNEPPKGMAEVVMIPVVPALLNAIFDATGHRFQSLPVTQKHAQGSARVTTLGITINGRAYGPIDVRDDLTMNDFLREILGLTGTKFGCGAAQCLSCAVIVDNPDGTSYTSPTCVVPAASFNGKAIRTVEGHAKDGELSALQKAFIEHFAFQCGYCTAGFLNEGQVLLERLAKKPVARADLEKTIAEALDGHLCRCTGYVKYHEAVRDVILADPGRYLVVAKRDRRSRRDDGVRRRPKMKSEMRVKLLVAVAALPMSMLDRLRRVRRPDRTASRRRRALPRSPTRRRGRRHCSPSSARC